MLSINSQSHKTFKSNFSSINHVDFLLIKFNFENQISIWICWKMEILFFVAGFTPSLVFFNQRFTKLLQTHGNHSITVVNVPYTNESWSFDHGATQRIDLINEKLLELNPAKMLVQFFLDFFIFFQELYSLDVIKMIFLSNFSDYRANAVISKGGHGHQYLS